MSDKAHGPPDKRLFMKAPWSGIHVDMTEQDDRYGKKHL